MKRHPYADFGLSIAICLFFITLINAFLFDLTIVKMLWLTLTIAYFVVSYKFPSDSTAVRNSTHALIALSILGIAATLLFDTKAQPTAHAFEGAATDTIEEEVFILEDKDIPVSIEPDTISEDSTSDEEEYYTDSLNAVTANDSSSNVSFIE